jgi:hypothetical protein
MNGYVSILFTTPSRFDPFSAFPQSSDGFSASIDYLIIKNQETNGLLEGMIDEKRIGIMGHSMGAMASLKAAAEDSRIRAVVSLAPGYLESFSFTEKYLEAAKSITAPTQIIMGSEDIICPPSGGTKYYHAIPVEKEMVIIKGAFHDLGIWNAGTEPAWLELIPSYDSVKQEYYRKITTKYLISWFNYYLYNRYDYLTHIYGEQVWSDLKSGILSELEYSREYRIIILNEQLSPIENCRVTISNQKGTILWNATTNANGTITFKLNLTPSNYTDTLHLKAVKGNTLALREIGYPYKLNSDTIIIIYSTPTPTPSPTVPPILTPTPTPNLIPNGPTLTPTPIPTPKPTPTSTHKSTLTLIYLVAVGIILILIIIAALVLKKKR